MRKQSLIFMLVVCAFLTTSVNASYVVSWSGTNPVTNHDMSVEAEFVASGDGTLTVTLTNTSNLTGPAPADLLGSLYFDISDESGRPTLVYGGATGDIYQNNIEEGSMNIMYDPDADIHPGSPLDDPAGWLFQTFDPDAEPSMPYAFGIGTVGNANFNSIGFNFPGMDGPASMIYDGTITNNGNLDTYFLVNGSATFTFTGMGTFTENDIGPVGFGFGTAPEVFVPLPATIILGFLGLGVGGWKLRKSL